MTDSFYAGGGIGLGPRPVADPPPAYPAPLVSSRDGVAGPAKTAVRDMVRLAEACGWDVTVTYARGWWQHATTGQPGAEPKDSLAVRMDRAGQRGIAVYVGGSTWTWGTLWLMGGGTVRRYPTLGAFLDGVFSAHQGTHRWHAPWIWPGRP